MAKKARTKASVPGGGGSVKRAAKAGPGHNSGSVEGLTDDEQRALFVKDRDAFVAAKVKLASATADLRNVRKRIKADGFTVAQVEDAVALSTPEGEARVRDEHERRLTVLRWMGVALAEQANAADAMARAREAGVLAGTEGRMRQSPYSPESAEHDEWMTGYYQGQEVLAKSGFKALPDEPSPPSTGL